MVGQFRLGLSIHLSAFDWIVLVLAFRTDPWTDVSFDDEGRRDGDAWGDIRRVVCFVGGGHGWLVRFFSFLLETHQVGFDPLLGSNGGRVLIRSERGERTVERTILYVRQPTPPHTCTPVSYPLDPHVVRRTSLLVDRPGHVPERYDTNATTGTNKTKEKETSVGSTTNPNRKRKKKEQEGAFRRTGGCRERQIGVLHDWRKHHQVVGARTWMRGA